jgi:lipopolysaccharide exporter
MAKGAAWMVLFKLLERSIGLFSMLFLARILMPADFGLVSLATATIAILEVLGSFSFDIALIQRKESDRSHYDTAWTFNVIVGVLACLAVFLLAQPAASFYEDSRLKNLLYLLAFGPLLSLIHI